ncbi:hypothetical protein EON80_21935, partial [bacterium]
MSDANQKTSADVEEQSIISTTLKPVSAGRGALERRVSGALGGAIERASWRTCRQLGANIGLLF